MTAALAVEARAVTKVFGSGHAAVTALRGVDLQVAQEETVMLVGPSGSGKTTLLSIIGCVLTATGGEVALFGHSLRAYRGRELAFLRRALFGFVFQGYNLIPALSTRQNVALPLRLQGVPKRPAETRAAEALERVGLGAYLDRSPNQLSGGEMQRVAVARALVASPPLVLADEPTASLDAESGRKVTLLLRELVDERGGTLLIVTHDARIFDLADRIVHIEDGRIVSGEGMLQ